MSPTLKLLSLFIDIFISLRNMEVIKYTKIFCPLYYIVSNYGCSNFNSSRTLIQSSFIFLMNLRTFLNASIFFSSSSALQGSVSYTHLDVYKRQPLGVCDNVSRGLRTRLRKIECTIIVSDFLNSKI